MPRKKTMVAILVTQATTIANNKINGNHILLKIDPVRMKMINFPNCDGFH